jgi:uncharacterized protein YwgA
LAVPPLGCGQGGLEWRVVGPVLHKHLAELGIPVELYAPFGTPDEELAVTGPTLTPQSKVEPGAVALVEILRRIEEKPYHWPVGRTTFQRIAYFATEVGIPTRLEHTQASYGPWAPGMKRVLSTLVNNGLVTERRQREMLKIESGSTYEAARLAYAADLKRWDANIDAVVDLFLRSSARRAEVAATVHFVYKELAEKIGTSPTDEDVLAGVLHWKQRRKPPIAEQEIIDMIRTLALLGWIDVKFTGPLRDSEAAEIAVEA